MVLDAKALTWASQNNLDTAKLKAAKVPIYGKWYFPDIPPNVVMINLETGERKAFDGPMVAGEVLWVPHEELRRAELGPFAPGAEEVGGPAAGERVDASAAAARMAPPPEPLLAMSRPPAGVAPRKDTGESAAESQVEAVVLPPGVHLPRASIAPFLLGVGFAIAGLGVITSAFIFVVGLVWMIAGAIAWIRVGMLELNDATAHGVEHADPATAVEGSP